MFGVQVAGDEALGTCTVSSSLPMNGFALFVPGNKITLAFINNGVIRNFGLSYVSGPCFLEIGGQITALNDGTCVFRFSYVNASGVTITSSDITVESFADHSFGPVDSFTVSGGGFTLQPPTVAAAFSPTTISSQSTATIKSSTLTLTLSNPNSSSLSNVALASAALPTGLTGTSAATTCSSGTVTFAGGSLSLSGATLGANATCTVTISVSSTTPGSYSYTTGAISATGLAGSSATTPTALLVVIRTCVLASRQAYRPS